MKTNGSGSLRFPNADKDDETYVQAEIEKKKMKV